MSEITAVVPKEVIPDLSAPVALVAEADEHESDSGFDADSVASSITSISSSILKYREENGRTYHAYKVR